jgi:hypothetical protein
MRNFSVRCTHSKTRNKSRGVYVALAVGRLRAFYRTRLVRQVLVLWILVQVLVAVLVVVAVMKLGSGSDNCNYNAEGRPLHIIPTPRSAGISAYVACSSRVHPPL